MGEYWSSSDVVAWTDHDGPQRPPTGPPTAWYRGLAGAFGAWFVLAVIGCEVIHHSGGEHVPISPAETIGAAAVFLGLPAMAVLLANRRSERGLAGRAPGWRGLRHLAHPVVDHARLHRPRGRWLRRPRPVRPGAGRRAAASQAMDRRPVGDAATSRTTPGAGDGPAGAPG